MEANTGHLSVTRTARYFILGDQSVVPSTLIFVLHGYAMDAKKFLSHFELLVKPGVWVVAPEGLSRFYRRGFEGPVVASWMTREDRLFEITDYVKYLDQLHEHLKSATHKKTIVLGFSQGVATGSRWLCSGSSTISDFVIWCGEFAPDAGTLPSDLPDFYHVYASDDEFITAEQYQSQAKKLKMLGLTVQDLPFEGKHEIDPGALRRVFATIKV